MHALGDLVVAYWFSQIKILFRKEIKSILRSGNACYHSVQKLLSSSLLSKNLKTIILHLVLYGFETWSLTLREERRLRVFENRVLRGIFGPKRDEVTGEWRKLHIEELNDLYYVKVKQSHHSPGVAQRVPGS